MPSTKSTVLVVGGAALTVVAAVLPWLEPNRMLQPTTTEASTGSASFSGVDIFSEGVQPLFSGPVVAGIAVVAVAVWFAAGGTRWADASVVVGGGFVFLVGLLWVLTPSVVMGGGMNASLRAAFTNPGIGVFLTILGGALVLAGGVRSYGGDDATDATVSA